MSDGTENQQQGHAGPGADVHTPDTNQQGQNSTAGGQGIDLGEGGDNRGQQGDADKTGGGGAQTSEHAGPGSEVHTADTPEAAPLAENANRQQAQGDTTGQQPESSADPEARKALLFDARQTEHGKRVYLVATEWPARAFIAATMLDGHADPFIRRVGDHVQVRASNAEADYAIVPGLPEDDKGVVNLDLLEGSEREISPVPKADDRNRALSLAERLGREPTAAEREAELAKHEPDRGRPGATDAPSPEHRAGRAHVVDGQIVRD